MREAVFPQPWSLSEQAWAVMSQDRGVLHACGAGACTAGEPRKESRASFA